MVIHMLEKLVPGAKFKYVTFKGGGEAVLSVAGGHTHFTTENLSEGLALLEAKKLRTLAITSLKRMPQLPDLPTAIEAGYKIDAGTIRGFAFLAGVPKETAVMMENVLERAHKTQTWKDHARKYYYEDRYLGSAEYSKFLVQRVQDYRGILRRHRSVSEACAVMPLVGCGRHGVSTDSDSGATSVTRRPERDFPRF